MAKGNQTFRPRNHCECLGSDACCQFPTISSDFVSAAICHNPGTRGVSNPAFKREIAGHLRWNVQMGQVTTSPRGKSVEVPVTTTSNRQKELSSESDSHFVWATLAQVRAYAKHFAHWEMLYPRDCSLMPVLYSFPLQFARLKTYKPSESIILTWYWTTVLGIGTDALWCATQTLVLTLRLLFSTHITWPYMGNCERLWESSLGRRLEFLDITSSWWFASNHPWAMSLNDPSRPCNCRLGVRLKPRTPILMRLGPVWRLFCSLICTLSSKSPPDPPCPHLRVASWEQPQPWTISPEGVWLTTGCSRGLWPLFELPFANFQFSPHPSQPLPCTVLHTWRHGHDKQEIPEHVHPYF